MKNSAIITPVLAAGATASPYLYLVNITQRLCWSTCVDETPVFNPVFTLAGYSAIGTNAYVATINVQGTISYAPCNNNCNCCTKVQVLNQNFTIPFTSAAAPTSVTISQGSAINQVVKIPCCECSKTFVNETPLTLTIATAG